MARPPRAAVGGLVYHVLNRASGRATLFATPEDYDSFLQVVAEAQLEQPMPVFSYCVMPNHWHFILAPIADGGAGVRYLQSNNDGRQSTRFFRCPPRACSVVCNPARERFVLSRPDCRMAG